MSSARGLALSLHFHSGQTHRLLVGVPLQMELEEEADGSGRGPSAHWALKGQHATGVPAGGAGPHTRGRGASACGVHPLSLPLDSSSPGSKSLENGARAEQWLGVLVPDAPRHVPGKQRRCPAQARMDRPAPPTRSLRGSPSPGPARRASAACALCVRRGRRGERHPSGPSGAGPGKAAIH